MVAQIWVNIGSDIVLSPDSTKPMPELMLTYSSDQGIKIYLKSMVKLFY